MFYTYVLKCSDSKSEHSIFYIGYSDDIDERMLGHHSKSVQTTKKYDTVELVYYEACLNKSDALKREKQLKTGFGRGYLKRRIKEYLKIKRN
jgi:putative endonuclease